MGRTLIKGFYKELDDLREQGMNDASFGFLENTPIGDYFNLYDFLHGHCDKFAAALSDYYGYSIEYILDSSYTLVHAYCTTEIDGIKGYIDARGITTDAELFFEEFADFCTYKDGRFYDLKGECQVHGHNDIREMYGDDTREPNQDKDLMEFLKDNNSYYDVGLFERGISMKTLKDWPEGQTITQYLQVGDSVDNAMYEYFLNIMPPHYHYGGLLQVGGACDAVKDENGVMRNTYLTFGRDSENDCWVFKGECFSGVWVNRNPALESEVQEPVHQPIKFDVSVRQTRSATVSVEAFSRDEALDKVSAAVRGGDVTWDEGPLSFKDGYHPDFVAIPQDPWFSASEVKDTAWHKIEHAIAPDVPDDVFNSTAASFKITPKYNLVVWCDIAGEEELGQESRYFIVSIRENPDNDLFGYDIGAEWATADLSRRELEIAIDHCLEMDRANIREVSGKLVDDSQPQYGRHAPLDEVITEAQAQGAEKKTWAEERAEELARKPRSEWDEDDWNAHVYIEQLRAESDYINSLDDR